MNRSLLKKRVVIFVLLAFVITWFLYYIDGSINFGDISPRRSAIGVFTMFGPALANFITRAITKEGLEESYLKFNVEGNFKKCYLIPSLIMVLMGFFTAFSTPIVFIGKVQPQSSIMFMIGTILTLISNSVILWIIYFGEEYGWRGYLFPKLEQLYGTNKALIFSGVIWGVWHTPMLIDGQNFGTDFLLYPVSNIVLMWFFYIFIGVFFNYITKMYKSIYPVAIMHSINNNFVGVLTGLFVSEDSVENISQLEIMIIISIPVIIVGTISWIKMCKMNKLL